MDISKIDYSEVLTVADSVQMAKLIERHVEIWRSQSWIFVGLSLTEAVRIVKGNLLNWVKTNDPGPNGKNLLIVEKLLNETSGS